MRSTLLLVALACPLVANADIVDIKWTAGEFAHRATVAPKKFLEACGKLNRGESVAWQFSGSAPSDFNIHYHVGKDVIYPENRKDVASAEGTISVSLEQDYCWMWSNRSAQAVEIGLTLKRTITGK